MENVFFDLDGTLTDPAVGIVRSFQYALRAVGGPSWSDGDLERFIGPPLREVFQTILQSDDAALNERTIQLYRERFATEGLYENIVYPQIPEVLAELRGAGLRLWVATSKPKVYADRIIDHFGLRPFFEGVYGAELSGERSKKAELLAHLLRVEQVRPARTCMVGDRKHDVEGASAHGIAAIGVLWGFGARSELERAGASAIVDSVEALPAAIRSLSASPPSRDRST